MELHHRVGAVQVTGKAGDKGLAGHLGSVVVHGGAAAQTGGRGIPGAVHQRAGDIDAAAGHLEALGVQLVDGGHPQRVAQARAVLHRKADGVGHAQHGVGRRDVAALQRGADSGGGHRLFLKLCHGHHHHFHAQRSAQLAQQLRRTGGLGPEGEVLAAEQGFCMAVFHDAAHELFRAEALDLLKVRREVILHAQAGDQRVLVRRGQQALTLHFVVHRQPEGKHRRGSPVGSGPLHRTVDDGPVADVDAVEVAHGHGGALCGVCQRQRDEL